VSLAVRALLKGTVTDLIDKPGQQLKLRECSDREVYLEGSSSWVARDFEAAERLVHRARENVPVSSTYSPMPMGMICSVVAEVCLHSRSLLDPADRRLTKLHFADLQATNRASKASLAGHHLDASFISGIRGLGALGNCIHALSRRGGRQHIPYRDHHLTRMLQNCLGGSGRLAVLLCARSDDEPDSHDQLVCDLRFCARVRQVSQRPASKQQSAGKSAFDLLAEARVPERFRLDGGQHVPVYE
jgi:kinesin family protein 18/19